MNKNRRFYLHTFLMIMVVVMMETVHERLDIEREGGGMGGGSCEPEHREPPQPGGCGTTAPPAFY